MVATRLYTHMQVLNDDVALLSNPDPASFAEAVYAALTDRRRSSRVAGAASTLAAQRYGYTRYKETLAQVLSTAMERK